MFVNEQQSSFIPGRQGVNNVIIVQELVHSMRKKTSTTKWMAVKLDLEKAYDRISWSFLRSVLVIVNLQKLIDLIMYCIRSTSSSVLWNGEKLKSFVLERGLR